MDNNKNSLKFNVINKRVIFLFFLIGLMLKPVIHFTVFPETEEFVNYNKKISINFPPGIRSKALYGELKDASGNPIYNIVCEYVEGGDGRVNCFKYPKEIRSLSFKSHLQNLFMQKLWIFAISFVLSILIVWFFYPVIENKKT